MPENTRQCGTRTRGWGGEEESSLCKAIAVMIERGPWFNVQWPAWYAAAGRHSFLGAYNLGSVYPKLSVTIEGAKHF